MTRRWVPGTSRETGVVWEWVCDFCPTRSPEVARREDGLPSMDDMRARGWFIAKVNGDRCPACVNPRPTQRPASTTDARKRNEEVRRV